MHDLLIDLSLNGSGFFSLIALFCVMDGVSFPFIGGRLTAGWPATCGRIAYVPNTALNFHY
jgi:hypothetical protein